MFNSRAFGTRDGEGADHALETEFACARLDEFGVLGLAV